MSIRLESFTCSFYHLRILTLYKTRIRIRNTFRDKLFYQSYNDFFGFVVVFCSCWRIPVRSIEVIIRLKRDIPKDSLLEAYLLRGRNVDYTFSSWLSGIVVNNAYGDTNHGTNCQFSQVNGHDEVNVRKLHAVDNTAFKGTIQYIFPNRVNLMRFHNSLCF